jgi:hypothetical protein
MFSSKCDWLNDLHQIKIEKIADSLDERFFLRFINISYKGQIPKLANFCFFGIENEATLIVAGGEG